MNVLENKICEEIRRLSLANGVCHMAQLGANLKQIGITPEILGVERLAHYFKDHPSFILGNLNNTVSIIDGATVPGVEVLPEVSDMLTPVLCKYCQLSDYEWHDICEQISQLARPEDWHCSDDEHGLLKKYVKTQFCASVHEGKVFVGQGITVFHCRLWTNRFEAIYFVMEEKSRTRKFKHLCTEGSTQAKDIISKFGRLPEYASFGSPLEKVFDPNRFSIEAIDFAHIFHRASRFPQSFTKMFAPRGFNQFELLNGTKSDIDQFDNEYYRHLSTDDFAFINIKDRFLGEVRRAIVSIEETPSRAILGYNFKRNSLVHMVPLSLGNTGNPDVALMVVKGENGCYIAPTVLSIAQCRSTARMVSRLQENWLGA